MARILLTLAVALALLLGLAAAVSVLAYGTEPPREGTVEVAGLTGPATLAWDDSGRVWVEGPDEAAVAAGLGYAHAVDHGWEAALWRQAATGTLAEWFGDRARDLDLHARTLGFASLGRQTYDGLGSDDRALLDAYARGASAGFAEPGVVQGDAFIVADVVPGAWRPWDPLAVERLHAYLAAPALATDSTWTRVAATDSVVAAFVAADSTFRAFFQADGGGFSRAYLLGAETAGAQAAGGPTLVHQLSGGSSALDLVAPAVLRTPGRQAVALTIPGTLATLGGWSGGTAWALLPGAPLALERYAGVRPPPVFSRIVERDGDETLLEVARDSSGLILRAGRAEGAERAPRDTTAAAAPDSTAPDSTASGPALGFRVAWDGFALGTDLGAFRALRAGQVPRDLRLVRGGGLAASGAGLRVIGRPRLAVQRGGVALVAADTLARYALAVLADPPLAASQPDSTADDTTALSAALFPVPASDREVASAWARDQLPGLLRGLGARDSLPDALQASYSYLKGWDGAYRPDGIAPAIFEWWLWSHRDYTGHLPDASDSLDVALLPSTLRIARAELRDRYGPLPSDWRWGRIQGGPSWPVLGARSSAAARRFREPIGPPGGHPTSALPGPSVVFDDLDPGLAVWSVRTRLRDGRTEVRSPLIRPLAEAGVDLVSGPDGPVLVLDPSAPMPARRLTLAPAAP